MTKHGVLVEQQCNTNIIIEYEKKNSRTKKLVKIIKGSCSICGRDKYQIFTK